MMIPKRSTNERVLARHHFKRAPAVVDPAQQAHDAVADPSPDDPDIIDGIISQVLPDDTTKPAAAHVTTVTPAKPTVTVLPGIGKATNSASTTPAVVKSVKSTTVPKAVSSTQTPVSTAVSTPASTPKASTPVTSPTSSPPPGQSGNLGVSQTTSGTSAPASSASDSASSQSSAGISPGAIGAVVAVLGILALALAAFFVRKRHQRRRALKRNTWGAGLVPSLENKRQSMAYGGQAQPGPSMSSYGNVTEHERPANVPPMSERSQSPASQAFGNQPSPGTPSTVMTPTTNAYAIYGPPGLAPPASAYNPSLSSTPISPFIAPSVPTPSLRSVAPSMSDMGAMSATPAAEFAIVARTFIPTLPDELHISNGEQIRVISAYDDGWALCANARGEQGVVPLECLERGAGAPAEMQLQPQSEIGSEANRTSRRISSLAPNMGTY